MVLIQLALCRHSRQDAFCMLPALHLLHHCLFRHPKACAGILHPDSPVSLTAAGF